MEPWHHIEQRVRDRLASLLRRELHRVELETHAGGFQADAVYRDDSGNHLVVEAKATGRPSQLSVALEQVSRLAAEMSATPVIVVPYMSPAGAESCTTRGVSFLDLSGNVHIELADALVHIEGKPNLFPERGRPGSAFAPRSARATRAMLQDPNQWWSVGGLADETGLTPGAISKVASKLEFDGLVERDEQRRLRPAAAMELLAAWVESDQPHLHHVRRYHVPVQAGVEVTRVVSRRLENVGVRHAATGLAGAWLLDQHAMFRVARLYVEHDVEEALVELGIRETDRGSNLALVRPSDIGVLDYGSVVEGVPCVSLVQVYVDIHHESERASEAAASLRRKVLGGE